MGKETSTINRSFYSLALDSETRQEILSKMRGIMDEEDVAVVEREYAARQNAENDGE